MLINVRNGRSNQIEGYLEKIIMDGEVKKMGN
jgi:hypothetical protein